jgi:glyoxylase-like metal-dependent hydrolase (beta-lactamase superfamily II)
LLIDLGWPGTMGLMQANLRRMGVPLSEIRYALATHYHIDHAGLAQELKNVGVPLLVIDVQLPAIPLLKRSTKPSDHFVDITMTGNVVISTGDSRDVLRSIGIDGEIVHTPGHSDDSVSVLLDDGSVFVGDLTPPGLVTEEQASLVRESWLRLRDRGARQIYPGHGPERALQDVM